MENTAKYIKKHIGIIIVVLVFIMQTLTMIFLLSQSKDIELIGSDILDINDTMNKWELID